ncbi:MAG: HNH endonuclease domain-containing protein, partial [Pseudomonadota bacterium]|nr:HNH endonuclease domain-containing protein [Pseudomonadota bacterium]
TPGSERDQSIARAIYTSSEGLHCVWSDKALTPANLVVDHMLPFSVWRNNDLWNLLPAESKVNNLKSDKIPRPELLRKRQEQIVSAWRFSRERESGVFQFEVERTLGRFREASWEQELFQYLSERAVVAIYRRGETAWDYGA